MAIHIWTGQQIRDSAGAPVNGGKLRIYTANTTSLANVYSDTSLATPLANPVVADSLGFLPDIFLSDASNYDCAELTAAGSLIRSYDDIPAVGSDGATFVKDFTGSRLQAYNSAGVVQLESGDPDPDDTGGSLRIGGWEGSQGTALELDYATADFTGDVNVAGDLTVGGDTVALDSVVESGTATAASTLDVPLTGGGLRYRLELMNLTTSASVSIGVQFAFDSVPTFKSGVADYSYQSIYSGLVTTDPTGAYDAANASINLTSSISHLSTGSSAGYIDIFTPANTTGNHPTQVLAQLAYFDTAVPALKYLLQSAGSSISYGRATYVRIVLASGTLSCKWRLIKMNGF
jgi:hypothetical protein